MTATRYYISDEDFPKAAYFNMLGCGHWSIENQPHRNLDITFKEDACRARKNDERRIMFNYKQL